MEAIMKKLELTNEEVEELFQQFKDFIEKYKKEEKRYKEFDEDSYNELYVFWWNKKLSKIAPWDIDCRIDYAEVFIEWSGLVIEDESIKYRVIQRLEKGIEIEKEIISIIC